MFLLKNLVVIGTDFTGSSKSNYHMIMTMTAPIDFDMTTWSVVLSGTPVCSTNKTDCHDIADILLKVALNTIYPPV
jgi:hypothetical protein